MFDTTSTSHSALDLGPLFAPYSLSRYPHLPHHVTISLIRPCQANGQDLLDMSSEESWDMSASSAHIFPKAEADRLKNEQNYYVWSVRMKNAFETCDMWGIVNGSETIPSDDTAHVAKRRIWIKKDNLTKAMITQCIKADLVIKVAHAKRAKESWDIFLSEFSQTGSGSIMLWFQCLTKQLPSSGNVSTHVMGFQEAICNLANAKFDIPGYIAAAILLSTLPSNPGDPHSWNQHIAGVKIDKDTRVLVASSFTILQ